MKAGVLRLSQGIEITATGGYRVSLTDALLEVRKGHIVTDKPVRAIFPEGSLVADRLEIFDHGDRTRFEGNVVLRFRLPPPSEAKTAETAK
jgi:hypothetical protein